MIEWDDEVTVLPDVDCGSVYPSPAPLLNETFVLNESEVS
jgi:hypothetical protein